MAQISLEVDRSITLRAEKRRKQLLDVLGEAATPSSSVAPILFKGTGAINSDIINKEGKKEVKGKENVSPQQNPYQLLFPARPPRSVYTSPLIQKNREPLWKNPAVNQCASFGLGSMPQGASLSSIKCSSSLTSTLAIKQKANVFKSCGDPSSFNHPSLPRIESVKPTEVTSGVKDLQQPASYCSASNDPVSALEIPVATSFLLEQDESATETVICSSESCESKLYIKENSYANSSGNDIEDSYDMDQFLEEALGSQLGLSSPNISSGDKISVAEEFPCFLNLYPNSNINLTSSTLKSQSTCCVTLPRVPCDGQEDRVVRLLREADIQQQVMMQASKAIYLCRSAHVHTVSIPYLVDGERLLLLSTLRHQAALNQIKCMTSVMPANVSESRGDLQLLEVEALLKANSLNLGKSCSMNCSDLWLLCVLSCGEHVVASNAVAYKPGTDSVKFTEVMRLLNLPSTFVATLQIYSLWVNHSRQELSKRKGMQKVCKLLWRQNKSCLGPAASSEQVYFVRTPAFSLSGTTQISLMELNTTKPNPVSLEKVPLMSPLQGALKMQLKTFLRTAPETSGFLDVWEQWKGCPRVWQRRWCHMSNLSLRYWSYPSDQDLKDPVGGIDLRACITDEARLAPRSLCPRARTFMLETNRSSTSDDFNSTLLECNDIRTIERHFLSCDSLVDLDGWIHAINRCLDSIRVWKLNLANLAYEGRPEILSKKVVVKLVESFDCKNFIERIFCHLHSFSDRFIL